MRFVADRMRRSVAEALADHGLSWCEYAILVVVGEFTGLPQGAVSERAAVDRTRTSDAVLRLEEHEWVRRDEVLDRRKRHVYLTETGRSLLEAARDSVEEAERTALLPLDPRERTRLAALLAKLIPPDVGIFGFRRV